MKYNLQKDGTGTTETGSEDNGTETIDIENMNVNGFIYQYCNSEKKEEYLENYLSENKIDTVEKRNIFANTLKTEYDRRVADTTLSISAPGERQKRINQAKEAYEAVYNYGKFSGGQTSGGRCRESRTYNRSRRKSRKSNFWR